MVKYGYDKTTLTDTWNSMNSEYMTSNKSLEDFIEKFIHKMNYYHKYNKNMMKLIWTQVTCSNFDSNLTPKQDLCQTYKQLLIQNATKLYSLDNNDILATLENELIELDKLWTKCLQKMEKESVKLCRFRNKNNYEYCSNKTKNGTMFCGTHLNKIQKSFCDGGKLFVKCNTCDESVLCKSKQIITIHNVTEATKGGWFLWSCSICGQSSQMTLE